MKQHQEVCHAATQPQGDECQDPKFCSSYKISHKMCRSPISVSWLQFLELFTKPFLGKHHHIPVVWISLSIHAHTQLHSLFPLKTFLGKSVWMHCVWLSLQGRSECLWSSPTGPTPAGPPVPVGTPGELLWCALHQLKSVLLAASYIKPLQQWTIVGWEISQRWNLQSCRKFTTNWRDKLFYHWYTSGIHSTTQSSSLVLYTFGWKYKFVNMRNLNCIQ